MKNSIKYLLKGQWLSWLLLCLLSTAVQADNATSSCTNTTVNNDGSNTCYTITPPQVDGSGITIDGSEVGAEWTGAKSKNLTGDMAGSFKVLRSSDSIYLLITVSDGAYNASDRISVFFDVQHNHATTTDDIEFRIVRDTGGTPNHQKITSSGASSWVPATLGSELGVTNSAGAWVVEVKITDQELAVSDLPPIIGIGIDSESLDSGDLASWPTNFNDNSPSTTWANLKNRYPIEYVIAMDQSGSMLSESKWDNAISAANYMVNAMAILRDAVYFQDQLGLATFAWPCSGSDATAVAIGLTNLSAFPVGDYAGGVTAPVSSNCTPIGEGLDMAFNTLGTGSEDTQRVVLLLSDGLHNRPTSTLLPTDLVYNPCASANWDLCPNSTHIIQVNTIAFGEGDWSVDTDLLNDIKNHFQGVHASTFQITSDPNDLKQTFIDSLQELYQMNLVHTGAPAEFVVDANNRKLIVIGSWTTTANAATFQLQHKVNPADPWTNVACSPSAADTTVGFAVCSVDEPDAGTWRASNMAIASDRLFVMLDLNLRARFAVDQVVHGTGMDILLTADINQAGQAVTNDATHPVTVNVHIEKPGEGLGTFLSTHSLDNCADATPQLPDVVVDDGGHVIDPDKQPMSTSGGYSSASHYPTSGDPAANHYQLANALLKVCGLDGLPRNSDPGLSLYDDGTHGDVTANDGIYSLSFTNTEYEGSYVFRFMAKGTAPNGDAFTRTRTMAEFVRVNVEPSNSETEIRILDQVGSLITKEYAIIPRDAFNGYLGPGHLDQIDFLVNGGVVLSDVRDYNNGLYSIIVQYDQSQGEPNVVPVVQGKPIDVAAGDECILPPWVYIVIILLLLLLLLLLFKCCLRKG